MGVNWDDPWDKWFFIVFVLLGFVVLPASAPLRVQPEKTEQVLKLNGYTEIETGGYAWFRCSEKDFLQTKWEATATNGQRVKGCYCEGVFKSGTVRITEILTDEWKKERVTRAPFSYIELKLHQRSL